MKSALVLSSVPCNAEVMEEENHGILRQGTIEGQYLFTELKVGILICISQSATRARGGGQNDTMKLFYGYCEFLIYF